MVDRGMNQVRVRGAGVPINVPRDTPQPPPTNPYYPYPGEDPYQPSEQASSWDPVREWFTESEPFSFFTNFQERLNNLPVVGQFFENASLAGPEGARERFNEDISQMRGFIPFVTPAIGAARYLGDLLTGGDSGRQEGDPIVESPFPAGDAVTEAMEQPAYSGPSFEEMLAQYQFDGSPYDRAAEYMQERRAAQMRAIQDMYNQYAAETQANVDRIGDIYTGAETGIGEAYGGASTAIEDAYASAQQQAADQMARLGIEEAAPAVIDPMALSQAETLSNLETNRASGLGATQQFGATAGGYASNMATVAQQQALENQRSITDQLVDQLFELEMQRAEAEQAYNPYQRMMQEMEARQAYENMVNPQPDPGDLQNQAEFLYQQEQDDANLFRQYYFGYLDDTGYDQQAAREMLYSDIQSGFLGPRMKQWLESNPDMAIQLTQ